MTQAPLAAVTGATGLVGSALVRRLLAQRFRVRVLVRSQGESALGSLAPGPGLEVVRGVLEDANAVARLCDGAAFVFNAAALVSDWGERDAFWAVNCHGVERLCEAARAAEVQRLVHVSTVDVFGFSRHAHVDEASPRVGYRHHYAESKHAGEEHVWRFSQEGLAVSVLYPTWVFGPGDRHFMPAVVSMLQQGGVPKVDGGKPHLEMTYSENLADAAILVASSPDAAGQGYIVGDGYGLNLGEFMSAVADKVLASQPTRSVPFVGVHFAATCVESVYRVLWPAQRPPLTRYAVRTLANGSRYDIGKLRALGYRPRVGFAEALDRSLVVGGASGAIA